MDREKLNSEMDYLKHLVDKVDDMFDKLFITDNGQPPLREQVHQNTKHRCDHEKAQITKKKIWTTAVIGAIFTLAIAIFSYFHLA